MAWLTLAAALLSLLVGVAALARASRNTSATFERRQKSLEKAGLELIARMESLENRWMQARTELGGLQEAVEDVLDRVERKRASVAATESRRNRKEQAEQGPMSKEDEYAAILNLARQQGMDL